MNVAKAIEWLQKAIALHARHMSGDAPTTGEAGEKSQKLMMDQMEKSLSFLQDKPASKMPAMNSAAMTQVRVNVSTVVNANAIRREKRNGRDVIIVPSATLPDDIIMNGSAGPILYPAEEIKKGFSALERTPAPLGHPSINGRFVSAKDPEGLNQGWIGAWNENVRQEGGRVKLDKVIDVEVANRSEGGRAVLAAIDAKEPIHTSTGLHMRLEVANAGSKHKFTARDMVFDHDAILLDQPGAATPDDGVGIFVNAAGDPEEVEVINSVLSDEVDRELEWGLDQVIRAVEREQRLPLLERIKSAIREALRGDTSSQQVTNAEEASMDQAQLDELAGKLTTTITDALSGVGTQVGEAVANAMKPVTDQLTANAAAQKVKDDAARAELEETVVNAGLLDEATAKEATLPVLNALAKQAKPGTVTVLNRGFNPSAKTDRAPLALKGE